MTAQQPQRQRLALANPAAPRRLRLKRAEQTAREQWMSGNETLQLNRTNWRLNLAGVMPVLVGTVFLLTGASLWPRAQAPLETRVVVPLVGGAVFLFGIVLTFGRCGTCIDRQAGTLTRWWGLTGPWWRTTVSLQGIQHVELTRRISRGSRSTHRYYEVHLVGAASAIPVVSLKSETLARRAADQAAKYLDLALHDKIPPLGVMSRSEPIIRQPHEIGVDVGQRVRTGLEKLDLPARPAELLPHIEPLAKGAFEVTFPPQGCVAPLLLMAAVGGVFAAVMTVAPLVMVSRMKHAPTLFSVCAALPGMGLALLLLAMVVGAARTKVRLYISPQVVEAAGGLWRTEIPASQLEEVRVEGTGGSWMTPCFVLIRSAGASARVGGSRLSRAEGEYLAALIKAVVAKGQ
jgi:hypothetical protein